jgi:imidazolonepropionase-like amidohydrolase
MKPRWPALPDQTGAGPSTPAIATCCQVAGKAIAAVLVAACMILPGPAALAATENPTLITIRNVSIVDPADGTIARQQRIEVRKGVVVSIGSDRSRRPTQAGLTIDGRGRFAIPGLWDAHVHILQAGAESARRDAGQLIAHGVTHARDMGSGLDALSAFRADPRTREAAALHLLAAGPTFWTFELPYGDSSQKMLVRAPEETDAAVDRLAGAGVDLIKPYAGFDRTSLARLVASASRHELQVAGHAQSGLSLEDHARIGLSTVEHFDFSTFAECTADADSYFQRVIAARFRNSGESIPAIYADFANAVDAARCGKGMQRAAVAGAGRFGIVPTLQTAFMPEPAAKAALAALPPSRREQCELYLKQFDPENPGASEQLRTASRRLMAVLEDSGIAIVAGTDAPAFCAAPGPSVAQELALLHEAGLPPLEVLRAATLTPARILGLSDRYGRILVDRPADLVLLAANPLERADAYANPAGVLVGNQWWGESDLLRLRGTRQATD